MKNNKTNLGKKETTVKQILLQFWYGTGKLKSYFFWSLILFTFSQTIRVIVPIYYKNFFDTIATSKNPTLTAALLVGIIVSILILHLIDQVFWQVAVYLYSFMQAHVMANLKQTAFNYLMRHSHTFFTNNFSGSLVQKIGRFSRAYEILTDSLVYSIMPLFVTVVGSIIVTWFIVPMLSVIIIIWVILFTIFSIFFSNWKLKYDKAVAEADSQTTGYLSDSITNNNSILFFTGNKYESNGFKNVSDIQAKRYLFSWYLGNFVDFVQVMLITFVEFFLFYFAIKYWKLGVVTIGTFVLGQTYIIGLAQQLWGLNKTIRNFYQSLADSKEMVDILLTKYEIEDVPNAKALDVQKGEIEFRNVTFYFNEENKILDNLNLTIKPKEKVAIVGHSGAGKTTLVRLIMRLYNVSSGTINIDGQDISKVTQDSLRENVSFVPQDPVLFHRSLLENIRYGNRKATDEEVKRAAKLAHCDEFIEILPNKYNTYVGERGIKLSGGERQRVAIARAILKKAPILIFDEATSSLDSYSESLIQDALRHLMENSTTIVIAHRLSTIRKMDRIISMEKGLIVEDGTHEELSNKESGLYKNLWDLQVSGFI